MLLIGAISVSAAAPIRVGVFKGTGWRWTSSTHVAAKAIDSMLANPVMANLGPNLITPPDEFVARIFGVVDTPGANTQPSLEQKTAFLSALDSLDVIVLPSNSNFGVIFDQPQQREKLERFFKTRGVVSLAWSIDRTQSWGAWDSMHGTRFAGWMCICVATIRRDSMAKQDSVWRLLNRGLPDTARFRDEWLRYGSATTLRASPGLKVTMRLDSASGSFTSASDHPYNWYREFPEGGRFFYTGSGYRAQLFTGAAVLDSSGDTTTPATNFFRRQLYNAILWAAGADSNGVVSVRPAGRAGAGNPLKIWVSGSRIHVQVAEENAAVELRFLDGRLLARKKASSAGSVEIEKPSGSGALIVRVRGRNGTQSALVAP
jgi:hypothetical protein